MARDKVIGKLDRFLDKGIRYYFYRVFWDDYPLRQDIELAGYLSESLKIEADVKTMKKPTARSTSKEYNALVKSLNEYATNPSARPVKAWHKIQTQAMSYFDSGLKISNSADISSPGYTLDLTTQTLKYYNGKRMIEVADFSGAPAAWEEIRQLFPNLFTRPSAFSLSSVKTKSLTALDLMQLIHITHQVSPQAVFDRAVEPGVISLFMHLDQHATLRTKLERYSDHRNAEELANDIVRRMKAVTTKYKADPYASANKVMILEQIEDYLDTGDYSELEGVVREYDGSWLGWMVRMVYSDEVDKALSTLKEMRKSPFFELALQNLKKERDLRDAPPAQPAAAAARVAPKAEVEREYEYDSHIVDFDRSEATVNAVWQKTRITKQAFTAQLEAMLAQLDALKGMYDITILPKIPLPKELLLEVGEDELVVDDEKTVIEHIEDCIGRLQAKARHDRSNSSQFQTDCAVLQNSMNRILNYQYQGRNVRKVVTEEQRTVYNAVGKELTATLNKIQKQPPKVAVVMNSVQTVRAEIHRLTEFHNKIRGQLAQYQQQLMAIDQGTFANDIDDFLTGGLLDERQRKLQDLLASLQDCHDDPFNVLSPADAHQQKICDAVTQLTEYETSLVDELNGILLKQAGTELDRVYKKVGSRNDAAFASQFADIMEDIRSYSDTLAPQESSKLGEFFTTSQHAPAHGRLNMFAGHGREGAAAHERDSELGRGRRRGGPNLGGGEE